MPVLVLHYHELWLKGGNRNFFLRQLTDAVRLHLGGLGRVRLEHEDGRLLLTLDNDQAVAAARERLLRVFGVAHYSIAEETTRDLETVARVAWSQLARQSFATFAVRARRADKTLPFRSSDAEREVGRLILDQAQAAGRPLKVNLEHPEVTCRLEFTRRRALVYSEKIRGPGGMPSNTAGKLVCLLSGGYDSAVAAYQMMRRGARLTFVHFHGVAARPGESSEPIARELVETLTAYQGAARLYLVPFYELQREILLHAPEEYRILLYRRLMLRIAESIAFRRHALGVITGDCLAQVASQTLQNMNAVGAVARLPVYRPLIGQDKQDILDLARKIGTYDTSSERFTDCCPAFLPRRPSLFASPEELDRAEEKLDIPAMVRRGVAGASVEVYQLSEGRVVCVPAKRDAALPANAAL